MIIDVIILTDNTDVERTKITIDSLNASNGCTPHIYLVSKNGYKYYNGVCQFVPVYEEFNYNRFLNKGFNLITADWIVISNDDVTYHPEWFNEILKVHTERPDIESFSPRDTILHKRWYPHLFSNEETYHEGYGVTELFQGWCIAIKKDALRKILPLDEQFDMYYQDNDFAECLKKVGVKHALVKYAKADHQSTHDIGFPYSDAKIKKSAEDEYKFRKKWNL
jgi:glycosyltransferase involved in cell wall biosynthesis